MSNITLQLVEDLLQKYKYNVIQQANIFKNTTLIFPSNEKDTIFMKNDVVRVGKKRKKSSKVRKKFILEADEENIIDKVDYLHHQVLRNHSSIKSIIKSELKRDNIEIIRIFSICMSIIYQ